MMYLFDTNVISELRNQRRANPAVWAWSSGIDRETMYLSAISVMEVEIGILRLARRDPAQAAILRTWFNETLIPAFAERILPVDQRVALATASLHVPVNRPERDALIAATALVHNLTVVTRNIADFAGTGVKLLNPWEAPWEA